MGTFTWSGPCATQVGVALEARLGVVTIVRVEVDLRVGVSVGVIGTTVAVAEGVGEG